ncbi:MAG: UDP pyrophosphate phosphatase [Candidatus Izimaplasma sp.]|nr:UDP pyrophosphate phosphatase [Candidatus Izimaplasma bacterium]
MELIESIKYLILGIVQGITEVLPISSSGHVEIVKYLLKVEVYESIIFLIIVNTGSLLTFVIIYFNKLVALFKGFFIYIFNKEKRETYKSEFIYMLKILVATIPAGIVGLLFEEKIDAFMVDYGLLLVAIGLLLTATVLFYITEKEPFKSGKSHLSWFDTIFIGLAQSVALIPGVSRSGMTSTAAIKRGANINTALDFAFIIYIPISFASIILMVYKIITKNTTSFELGNTHNYFFAFIGAMIATYIAYRLIFNIFKSGKLRYFSYYCFGASFFALILFII